VVSRPFLHAWQLSLDHPRTGEALSWTSELPDDLRGQLEQLEA
jgi:23S rRNA pseudouridine1911/1915/1917 synthase